MTEKQGRRVLVTGGSRGIGRGIVERFLADGDTVVVVQRRPVPEDLRAAGVTGLRADLTVDGIVDSVIDATVKRLGGLDVLVVNAGVMEEEAADEVTQDSWDRQLRLNLTVPAMLARAAAPHLAESGGNIVMTGSIEGLAANPEHAAYVASKAGIHGLVKALAVDLGASGVRCNAVAPGWISSDLTENYLDSMPDPAEARERVAVLHPLQRTGTPEDIGGAVRFLASEDAAFVTGHVLVVDGGRTAQLSRPF